MNRVCGTAEVEDAERPRDEPPGQPNLVSHESQTLGWPGRLHRVVRRPVPWRSGAISPAVWRRAQEGFGSKARATLAGSALQVPRPESSVLDGPSRAYNGLEMSRPASQDK